MKRYILLFTFLSFAAMSVEAQQLLATSINTQEIRNIELPQKMVLNYLGIKEKLTVTGVTSTGLITEKGDIPFDELQVMYASHYKSSGKKALGAVVTILGLTSTAFGVALLTDEWGSTGAGFLFLGGGIAITAGGISLASSKSKYEFDKWKFTPLPSEVGKVPVTAQK